LSVDSSSTATRQVINLLAPLGADDARRCLERALAELEADAEQDVFGRRVFRRKPDDDSEAAPVPKSSSNPPAAPLADAPAPAPEVESFSADAHTPAIVASHAKAEGPAKASAPSLRSASVFDLANTWPSQRGKAALAATLSDEPSRRMTLPNIPLPAQMRLEPGRHLTPPDSELIRSATGRDWRPIILGGVLGAVAILLAALAFGGPSARPKAPAAASAAVAVIPTAPSAPASVPDALPSTKALASPQRARRATAHKTTAAPVDEVFGRWK
jgi:hypothetical protein